MANVKITALNAITPAATDVLPVVDVSADVTSKTTVENISKRAGDGTAAAPSHSFASDSDTGVYRAGANRLGLATAGVQRAEITATGNFLIGGTLPSSPSTTISSSGSVTHTSNVNSSGRFTSDRTASGNTCFRGQLNGTDTSTISADGSASFLGRVDGRRAESAVYSPTSNATSGSSLGAINTSKATNYFSSIAFSVGTSSSSLGKINLISETGGTAAAFAFQQRGSTSATKETLRIASSGNVLIGATLPSAPAITLNNSGNATFSGSVSIGGSAAANDIEEYESGTWTPVHSDSSNTATLNGQYRLIDDMIYIRFSASNGTLKPGSVSGLPFNNITTIGGVGCKILQSTAVVSDASTITWTPNLSAIQLNISSDITVATNVSSWQGNFTAIRY